MKTILEYIISKNTKVKLMIKATDETIKQIVKEELKKSGHSCDLNYIDTSKVTTFEDLFRDIEDFNCDVSQWNTSNVTNMNYTFRGCIDFNCDISEWDMSNVTTATAMLRLYEKFNQPIGKWKLKSLKNMDLMFEWCKKLDQNLEHWTFDRDVSHKDTFFMCGINKSFLPVFRI